LICIKVGLFTVLFFWVIYVFQCCSSVFGFMFTLYGVSSLITMSLLGLFQVSLKRFIIVMSMVNSSILVYILSPINSLSFSDFLCFLILESSIFILFILYVNFLVAPNNNGKRIEVTYMSDLYYIKDFSVKIICLCFLLILSGLPPFSVFIIKVNIIENLMIHDNISYSLLFVSISILNLFCYIRAVKMLFFYNNN
jgi:NADH:ubiquinone oxidoreductase subunit 2 (subunit N)